MDQTPIPVAIQAPAPPVPDLPKPIDCDRAKRQRWLAGKPVKKEIKPNPNRRHPLPSGFKEVISDRTVLPLTSDELPWLNGNHQQSAVHLVPLALVTLSDTSSRQFYLGSLIRHPALLQAARSLTDSQTDSVNQLFYSCLPDLVRQGFHPAVKLVEETRGGVNILYAGNEAGQRVYFMRFNPINSLAVIVKVAVCDKNKQDLVLGVLTTQSQRDIKKFGKL